MGKIFVRERRDVREGDGRPRFAIVGAQGDGIKFFQTHVRKAELEAIAQAMGADVVMLPQGGGEHDAESSGGGRRRRGRGRQGGGGGAASS